MVHVGFVLCTLLTDAFNKHKKAWLPIEFFLLLMCLMWNMINRFEKKEDNTPS